jgi:hypothetical protein
VYSFRFSAAPQRIKEFVGRGGLHCGGDYEYVPHFYPSPGKLLIAFVLAADSGFGNFGAIP